MHTPGGEQKINIINESGLYALIQPSTMGGFLMGLYAPFLSYWYLITLQPKCVIYRLYEVLLCFVAYGKDVEIK